MTPPHANRFRIARGRHHGFVDRTGAIVIDPVFDFVEVFREGLAAFERDGRRGLIDRDGAEVVVFGADVDEVKSCGEGLIPFRRGELWGYLDRAGRVAIEPQYGIAWEFEGGMAVVERDEGRITRRIFISPANDHLFERPASFLGGTFREGLATISHRGRMGYIDRSGRRAIPFRYLVAQDFSDGLAAVSYSHSTAELGDLPGVAYSDDRSWVAGYIDRQGRHQFDAYYYEAKSFSERLAAVQVSRAGRDGSRSVGRWGYIDRAGDMAIEPRFGVAHEFSEGLAGVSTRLKSGAGFTQGFINRGGDFVIRPRFARVEPFRDGLAAVIHKRRDAYVNPSGDLVWVADRTRR